MDSENNFNANNFNENNFNVNNNQTNPGNKFNFSKDNAFKKSSIKSSSGGFGKTVFVPFLSGIIGATLVVGACFGIPSIRNNLIKTSSVTSTVSSNSDGTTNLVNISDYSDTSVAVANKVLPSVVGITVNYQVNSIFGGSGTADASGSGIILTEDGYILTNNHVISSENSSYYTIATATGIKVNLYNDDQTYDATVIGTDPYTDLAVLKIDKTGLTPATLGDSTQAKVGEFVMAIGNPLNMDYSVTCGVISAVNREVKKSEPVSIEDTIVNSVEEPELNNDIENIFNDIYNEEKSNDTNTPSTNKQELLTNILSENQTETEKIAEFDMDNLIDEILSPIVKSSTFEEENVSSIENFKNGLETNDQENNFKEKADDIINESVVNFENEIKPDNNTNSENNAQKNINKEQSVYEISDTELDNNLDATIDNLITNLYNNAQNEVQKSESANSNINFTNIQETDNQEYKNDINIETEPDAEAPLIDVLNTDENTKNEETALIEVDNQDDFLVSPRSLSKFYMFKKKVKLAFYKLFVAIPKILSSSFNEDKTNK